MKWKDRLIFLSVTGICILLVLAMWRCGRQMVTGQVVNGETGQPIEGAVVAVRWLKYDGWVPGMGSGAVTVEVAEDLTDAQGFFKVPKYSALFKDYRMAVYKKGHVCWNSEKVFPTWEERKDFKLMEGMVIKLERFKDGYSEKDHARFTVFAAIASSTEAVNTIFYRAIREEDELYQSDHNETKRRN